MLPRAELPEYTAAPRAILSSRLIKLYGSSRQRTPDRRLDPGGADRVDRAGIVVGSRSRPSPATARLPARLPASAPEPRNVTVDLGNGQAPQAAAAGIATPMRRRGPPSAAASPAATAPSAAAPRGGAAPAASRGRVGLHRDDACSRHRCAALENAPAHPTSLATAGGNPQRRRHRWAVQLGSFASRENADKLAHQLKAQGFAVYVSSSGSGASSRYRVRVGPVADRGAADPNGREAEVGGAHRESGASGALKGHADLRFVTLVSRRHPRCSGRMRRVRNKGAQRRGVQLDRSRCFYNFGSVGVNHHRFAARIRSRGRVPGILDRRHLGGMEVWSRWSSRIWAVCSPIPVWRHGWAGWSYWCWCCWRAGWSACC